MLFIVRGKNRDQDRCLRVHAQTPEQAEAIGWRRGLFVTEVEPVAKGSEKMTRLDHVVEWACKTWRAAPKNPLKAFGRPVSSGQTGTLLLLGCTTSAVNLHHFGVLGV